MSKTLIITADDFGISDEINEGIISAFQNGILTSTALLVHAERTQEAIELAKQNPDLEVGLHLAIVESLSALDKESSLTGDENYFAGGVCLHKNWQTFIKKYLLGQIDMTDIEQEFELQIKKFLQHFESIPFVNGTQHLHILPGINKVLAQLCQKYHIPFVRNPELQLKKLVVGQRPVMGMILGSLGTLNKKMLSQYGLQTTQHFEGFDISGKVTEKDLAAIVQDLPDGTTEIMTHPGKDCPSLRQKIIGYKDFQWETELNALKSTAIKDAINKNKITLTTYGKLSL